MSDAHRAVELDDLATLRDLLDRGADIHEECNGLTLLHHAIDVEIDGHVQSGEPLHVDATAYLLARGADPTRESMGGKGISAAQMAESRGHWLASCLTQQWIKRFVDS